MSFGEYLRGSFCGDDNVDDVVGALVHLLRDERHRFHKRVEVYLLCGLVLIRGNIHDNSCVRTVTTLGIIGFYFAS